MLSALRDDAAQVDAPADPEPAPVGGDPELDGWLEAFFGERLAEVDAACAGAGPEAFALFRDVDDDLWALLLSRRYSAYPGILELLPELPEQGIQEMWNGGSGLALLSQSKGFYRHVADQQARHGSGSLRDARVLDFGCGWGRLTRFFARDVAAGALFGCDPAEEILEICRSTRVPAELARSEFVPERLPFDGPFELVYSFSVFTHISEAAARSCLEAIHAGMSEGGLLVLTVRPPAYIDLDPKLAGERAALGGDPVEAMREPRYVFAPHPVEDWHPQFDRDSGEMTYGEAVVSLPYVRERWADLFELVAVRAFVDDPYQVALTLRRT